MLIHRRKDYHVQQFYVKINNLVHGPLTGQQLQEMAQGGQLSPTDDVRLATSKTWTPAGNIKGLQFVAVTVEEEPLESAQPASEKGGGGKSLDSLDGIPDPPPYQAVSFFYYLYNALGCIVILAGVIACDKMPKEQSNLNTPLMILTFFIAACCFLSAQLLSMARNSAWNLHYLTHFNRCIMESIEKSKK